MEKANNYNTIREYQNKLSPQQSDVVYNNFKINLQIYVETHIAILPYDDKAMHTILK